jgi:uncharacterized membrane protein
MAHCTKCGNAIADNAAFCGSCGAAQAEQPAQPAPSTAPPVAVAHSEMSENVAGALCYALGWLTGLIFFFVDKRPFVRFHAAQSIVVFAGLNILSYVLGIFFGLSVLTGGWTGFSLGIALIHIIHLLTFVMWLVLMFKAYQGERFRVPIAADLADKIFGKS